MSEFGVKFVPVEELREKYFKFLNERIFREFFKHPYLTHDAGFATEVYIVPFFGYLLFYKEKENSTLTEVWFNEANETLLAPKCWRLMFAWDTGRRGKLIASLSEILDNEGNRGGQFVLGNDSLVNRLVEDKITNFVKEHGYDE